jgi:hypothetical protein
MHIDTKKVVELTKVTHGKFSMEGRNDTVKKMGGGGSEYYVVDIE